jgi:hypothetical protein
VRTVVERRRARWSFMVCVLCSAVCVCVCVCVCLWKKSGLDIMDASCCCNVCVVCGGHTDIQAPNQASREAAHLMFVVCLVAVKDQGACLWSRHALMIFIQDDLVIHTSHNFDRQQHMCFLLVCFSIFFYLLTYTNTH